MKQHELVLVAVVAMAGCNDDSAAPPSCQQSISHYYASGCLLRDLQTSTNYTQDEAQNLCQQALSAVPAACVDEFDSVRECWNSTPAHATSTADCDCSQELDAANTCH